MYKLCKEKQDNIKEQTDVSRKIIQKRVAREVDQLKPSEAEIKVVHTEIERESRFNPVNSSLAIIARAEKLGERLQIPIDASIARY